MADIENFPFHYTRHNFARFDEVTLHSIKKFDDPLEGVNEKFDVIWLQEVFEHLDSPRYIAEYLLNRLNPNCIYVFDYIKSDATGMDSIQGLDERIETLQFLSDHLVPVVGKLKVSDDSLPLIIRRKK